MPEIERDAALATVERLEEQGVLAVLERRHVTADVARRRWILDLDDLGAEVGELERPPRTCAELLHGDDPDVRERQGHAITARTASASRSTCSDSRSGATAGLNTMCWMPAAT